MSRYFKNRKESVVPAASTAAAQELSAEKSDAQEAEAESMAEVVMRMPENSLAEPGQAHAATGGGMDSTTLSFMQYRFGADFSHVKIHTGPQAVQLSRQLQAQAFTVGSDIYFNEGKYNPGTSQGRQLLAHELVHTQQQAAAGKTMVQAKRELDSITEKEINDQCIKRIGEVITTLEGNMAAAGMTDEIKEAVKHLREKYDAKKIKCCYLDGRDMGITDFTNGDICMDAKYLKDSPGIFANIGQGTVLHEGIHSLHTKKYPKATGRYGRLLKEQEEGKEIKTTAEEEKELLKLKAWTEYKAYRSFRDYNNAKDKGGLSEETLHNETMKDERLKGDLAKIRALEPDFDPRKWKPKG